MEVIVIIAIIAARAAWELMKFDWSEPSPNRLPPRQITARNAKKLMKNWHLMEDESAGKKISIRPKPGPAISENAGIYWHFLREGADVYNLVDRFVKRCLSTDLVVLAKNDPQTLYFKDKVRLYYTLNVLAQNMEWRHMGLMSSYIRSISRVESFW